MRKLDGWALLNLIVGLACGSLAYWHISTHGAPLWLIIPSIVAATVGAENLVKREAPRE